MHVIYAHQTERSASITIGHAAGRMCFTGSNHHALLSRWIEGEGWKLSEDFFGERDAAAAWLAGKLLAAAYNLQR